MPGNRGILPTPAEGTGRCAGLGRAEEGKNMFRLAPLFGNGAVLAREKEIRVFGAAESLNAAVAAGILMYEWARNNRG